MKFLKMKQKCCNKTKKLVQKIIKGQLTIATEEDMKLYYEKK